MKTDARVTTIQNIAFDRFNSFTSFLHTSTQTASDDLPSQFLERLWLSHAVGILIRARRPSACAAAPDPAVRRASGHTTPVASLPAAGSASHFLAESRPFLFRHILESLSHCLPFFFGHSARSSAAIPLASGIRPIASLGHELTPLLLGHILPSVPHSWSFTLPCGPLLS